MPNTSDTEQAIKKLEQKKLGNIKVLMVEDDDFFSEIVLSRLAKEGCIPYSSHNGDEAVQLAEQYHPHLVILDLMLPGKQGEEVLHELKAHSDLRNIPVIVFSNKSNQEDIEKNLQAGAIAFLIKSSTELNDLIDIVKDAVDSSKTEGAPA